MPDTGVRRDTLAVLFPVAGAAMVVGGVFEGAAGRVAAVVAGALGIAVGLVARRIRRPAVANIVAALALFAVGLLLVVPSGFDDVARTHHLARQAAASGDVLRPPVSFTAGWYAIVGWLMAAAGFAAVWVATVLRAPSLALLVPLPVAAVAAISVPDDQQTATGAAVLALFALGATLVSGRRGESSSDAALGHDLRRVARAAPVIAVVTAGLVALAETPFLFPDPRIDPAEEAQKPQTVPLSEVEDRVLFEVRNPDGGPLAIGGPWRLGTLDVYDGVDWRLPAFNDRSAADIPRDGVIDRAQLERRSVKAEFKVLGLGGAVLPGLPNSVAVVATGPTLAFDRRSGTLRLAAGQVPAGLRYTIAAAGLPTLDELRASSAAPAAPRVFMEMPPAPPSVTALLRDAEARFDDAWDRFDFLRRHVLETVTASGPGAPVSIPPSRVEEILGRGAEASPFEIVALQTMLARWSGLPARIGYGFDGGELVGERLQVRPRNAASFPEVFFPGHGWLPVIGTPRNARPTVGGDTTLQQRDPSVRASADVAVQIYLPELVPPPSTFAARVRNGAIVAAAVIALAALLYLAWPLVRKGMRRARHRALARAAGPRTRVALAYAEWRDHAADFGLRRPTDTPLMFLDHFDGDMEHAELAWLTTRVLWGDLREACSDEHAAVAEELARALRRRLSASQPVTMRVVAALSRSSVRDPFATDGLTRAEASGGDGAGSREPVLAGDRGGDRG